MKFDAPSLKKWFLAQKRDLPWRENITPYAVWVSEVMLQQTQVTVVIPYFQRWMQRFPTVEALGEASQDEVIKMWEGLGYYSRARNLHEGAKTIIRDYHGVIPATKEELSKIKGLGPYTIGAILGFAFHQKEPAVDGNVIRVLARHFMIEEDISKPATVKKIREQTESILPDDEPWVISEALIELGATVCSRTPRCCECPLKQTCLAHRHHLIDKLPYKSARQKTIHLTRVVPIITYKQEVLLRKGQKGEIMHDLHEFPHFDIQSSQIESLNLEKEISILWNLSGEVRTTFKICSQSFTKYRVKLYPYHFICGTKPEVPGYKWISKIELSKLAFSSGHKRILHHYLSEK